MIYTLQHYRVDATLVEWIRDSFDGCSRGDCGWMVAWMEIVFGTRQFRKY